MAESFKNLDNILRDSLGERYGTKILVDALNRYEKQKE